MTDSVDAKQTTQPSIYSAGQKIDFFVTWEGTDEVPKSMTVEFATDPLIPFVPAPPPQFREIPNLTPEDQARIQLSQEGEMARWRDEQAAGQQASEQSRHRFSVTGAIEGREDGRFEFTGNIPDPTNTRPAPGQDPDQCMLHKGVYRIVNAQAQRRDGTSVPVSLGLAIEIEIDKDYACLPAETEPTGGFTGLEIESPGADSGRK